MNRNARTSLPPHRHQQPSLGCLRKTGGNGTHYCSLATAGRLPPENPSPILH